MDLNDIISENMCSVTLNAKRKDDALIEMAQFVKNHPVLENLPTETIISSLREREKLGSTGFGDGIAIPHCKLGNIDDFAGAIMISKKGVDFDALDGKKTHIFFIIIAPANKPDIHIKLLASISRMVKQKHVRNELIASNNPAILYENFMMQIDPDKAKKKELSKNKKLVFIILYESYYLDDILEYLIELGITGSTVIDSIGMGGILTKVPLFASFIDFLGSNKNYSKTILAVIEENLLEKIITGVEDIMGNLDKRSGVMVFALDITFAKGTMEYL